MPDLFDAAHAGAVLAEAGMTAAVEHADAEAPGWSDRAYDELVTYAKGHHFFTAEDVRVFAEGRGLPKPPDARAWGAISKRGAKAKIMTAGGFVSASLACAHRGPKRQWISQIANAAGALVPTL